MSEGVSRTLGRYELLAEKGQDELGTVYQARDTLSGRVVSLRLLHRSWVDDDPSLRRRLALQVERLSRLTHPHVARLLALEESERNLFLVSEWAEGQTLRERLRREGALRPEQAHQILSDIAAALDDAHRQGLVHGDLQPDNILLTADGHALLTNTGIALTVRPLAPRALEHGHTDRLLIGSPASMAPELVRGNKPSPASDLYALGVVLYEMLAGRPPFAGEEHELLWAQVHDTPPPPSRWNRHLSAKTDAVLARALAKSPAARYATAAELLTALGQGKARSTGISLLAKPSFGRTKFARLPRVLLPAAGLLLLLLVGALILNMLSRQRDASALLRGAERDPLLGLYEVTAPRQLFPGQTASVRLVIRPPADLSPQELPLTPVQRPSPTLESGSVGTVSLCRSIWGRLEATGVEVVGPNALQRNVQLAGSEWLWSVHCPEKTQVPGKGVLTVQMFFREPQPDGGYRDVSLKEVQLEVSLLKEAKSLPVAPIAAGLAVMLTIALFAVDILRARARKRD